MSDCRVELAELASADDAQAVLVALDSVEIVVEAPLRRCRSRDDQIALYNMTNIVARLFAHVQIDVADVPLQRIPFGKGGLKSVLVRLVRDLQPLPAASPESRLYLSYGVDPSGPGVAVDGRAWSYSVGPAHLPLPEADGPPLGPLAAGNFAVSQAFTTVLKPLGLPGHITSGFTSNLLDYTLGPGPGISGTAGRRLGEAAVFGVGSVGSSFAYNAMLATPLGGQLAFVDPDVFKPRNKLRYLIMRRPLTAHKAHYVAQVSRRAGLDARGYRSDIRGYLSRQPEPPAHALALVSTDTVEGRRDATDVLAKSTLNAGVEGLRLHLARHGFDRETGCAYCQYVDVAPRLSGSELRAQLVGLPVERVVAIELRGGVLNADDAAIIAASGNVQGTPPQAGERLADVERRVYAQGALPAAGGQGQVFVSLPAVSAHAGLLLLAEALKDPDPALADFRLSGRVDFDLSGQPTGLVQPLTADSSGRCLCTSGFRRRAYGRLHAR